MKLLKASGIAITLLLVISKAAPAQTYDAVKDFSIESNPNGTWSYGYLNSWGSSFNLFTARSTGGDCVPNEGTWSKVPDCSTPSPALAHNDTGKPICGTTWCNPPIYVATTPGPNCELTVVRWTAPSSGSFVTHVQFIGEDSVFPTSTFVYVLLNSKRLLLQAPINSYELPLSFEPEALGISAGDTIDLIVGCGADHSWVGDSTGVEMKIWSLGAQ